LNTLGARAAAAALLIGVALPGVAGATTGQRIDLSVRARTVELTVYRPAEPLSNVRGTVFIGSGDVGWVGLAASLADFLSDSGYIVAGLNVRQYLSAFTSGGKHLEATDVPRDYAAMVGMLRARGTVKEPIVVSGVSEGAALAILAASSPENHPWISGVITMGLPGTAALAWRWSDFTSWITKKDADEPSFAPKDFIGGVSPLPLWLIQSTKDEYVPESDYRALETAARMPKQLILIDASNHRFTDRIPRLRMEFTSALSAIQAASATR
jgi:alpha-beta hydrolase superfamily lysophospholipase